MVVLDCGGDGGYGFGGGARLLGSGNLSLVVADLD